MRLLVFGSMNIDDVYQLPHLVREGETIASTGYARNAGGKGFNQAVALAKAGQKTCFAGAIGEDGLFLRRELDAMGVDTGDLALTDTPTGHAIIQVDAQGKNCIILYGGANRTITPERIDSVLAGYAPGDVLLMQNEISCGDVLLRRAAARGMRVMLNPSPISPELLRWPLDKVDTFLLNEIEGRDLTGETDPDAILDRMLDKYPRAHVVLTLGEDGAIYADTQKRIRQACIPASAIDTTAAGDTFTGYYLQAALSGKDEKEALLRAAQAAAIAVSRPGAGASVPLAGEVDAALSGAGRSPCATEEDGL